MSLKAMLGQVNWKLAALLGIGGFGAMFLYQKQDDVSGLFDNSTPSSTPTGGGRSGAWQPSVDPHATFQPILFGPGSTSVHGSYSAVLGRVAIWMREHPTALIGLAGYASTDGSSSANRRISQSRAEAVATSLLANGVPRNRITAIVGQGETTQWPGAQARRVVIAHT